MVKWRGRHLSWHLPLLTTIPHQREDASALELVTRQATIRYLYHLATAATGKLRTSYASENHTDTLR
ncbi:hypothetical protein TNCV_3750951 [Trichonephila clavipes]|uniref:Uncharacterized protein n=1 Tax=Trichonephila clavipes TaxID=2585209 RepID=A0A8X6UWM2_TRICX|nr:hypothetical protein TNCV_3750951 [Trichonephila clavipes]